MPEPKASMRDLMKRFRSLLNRESRASPGAIGPAHLGIPTRTEPLSRHWGFDRGLPIDRHYIEGFLQRQAGDIRGRVLEIGDDSYTRRFGGDRVTARDVLNVDPGYPGTTIVADLNDGQQIPSDRFDCVILTQTLQLIYDVRTAIRTLYRILRPGGAVLATVPGISRISHEEWAGSWYWGFSTFSAKRLFEESFPSGSVAVESHGNVLAASAFLYGMAVEEMRPEDLHRNDPDYQVTITVRAVKPGRGL
jgi:SAM-dependent methyltransferase